jgi:hypothetical protein
MQYNMAMAVQHSIAPQRRNILSHQPTRQKIAKQVLKNIIGVSVKIFVCHCIE